MNLGMDFIKQRKKNKKFLFRVLEMSFLIRVRNSYVDIFFVK